jgi:hypothetical protein
MSSDSASSCSPSAALPVLARFVIFVLFLFLLSWFCSCSPCFVVFVFFIWLICSCYDCVRFVPTDTSLFVWFLGGCWVRYWCLQGGGRRVWLPAVSIHSFWVVSLLGVGGRWCGTRSLFFGPVLRCLGGWPVWGVFFCLRRRFGKEEVTRSCGLGVVCGGSVGASLVGWGYLCGGAWVLVQCSWHRGWVG